MTVAEASRHDRGADSNVTLIMFLLGCVAVWIAAGFLWALATFFLGVALCSEMQRKANQILDALEKDCMDQADQFRQGRSRS